MRSWMNSFVNHPKMAPMKPQTSTELACPWLKSYTLVKTCATAPMYKKTTMRADGQGFKRWFTYLQDVPPQAVPIQRAMMATIGSVKR